MLPAEADQRQALAQLTALAQSDLGAKLLGRGAVYTEASVHFRAHDHCNCAAAPAWNSKVVDISHVHDDFTHSTRFRSDEARVKNARLLRDY